MIDIEEKRIERRITFAQGHREFVPTDRQQELYDALLSAPCPPEGDYVGSDRLTLLGYGGAMGGGKTRAIAELAIDAALAFPGNNILLARRNLSDLSTTTMKEFFQVCPSDFIHRRQQTPTSLVQLKLPHWDDDQASTINFRHLSDWQGLGSQQYGAVLIDEAGQVDEDAALMLLTRLRHPAQPQRWFVAASNPWPGWFQRWFVRRDLPEDAIREAQGQISFIPAKIADNPHLPENYAQINTALLPKPWRERFIDGRFDALLGRIYPNFDPNLHRWDASLPPFTYYVGGLDFGGQTETSHYTAAILAGVAPTDSFHRSSRSAHRGSSPAFIHTDRHKAYYDPDPLPRSEGANLPPYFIIRLAEFEDRGPGVIQRLEQFQRHCQRRFGHIRWCADRSQSAWIDHQKRQGIQVFPSTGGPGSVNFGISLVHERFAHDPPTSFYTPNLTQFPKRVSEYVWALSEDGAEPKPRKRNDDLLDADRYMHEHVQQAPRPFPFASEIDHLPAYWRNR